VASRDTRREQNQKLFRMGNERLSTLIDEQFPEATAVPFLCECADETCMGAIDLTLEDYRAVREHEHYYVILVDHPRSPGEEVVAHRDGYDITQKPD
jgi:hypothetical protein